VTTLIRLSGPLGALLGAAAARLGVPLEPVQAAEVWRRVLAGAGTPDQLARGRDLSPEHRGAVWNGQQRIVDKSQLSAPGGFKIAGHWRGPRASAMSHSQSTTSTPS
jgi:hypothetical protein